MRFVIFSFKRGHMKEVSRMKPVVRKLSFVLFHYCFGAIRPQTLAPS